MPVETHTPSLYMTRPVAMDTVTTLSRLCVQNQLEIRAIDLRKSDCV